jgi:hypothetical protein
MYGVKKIESSMNTLPSLAEDIEKLKKKITE